jgi:hypothetical protein
MDHHEIAGIDIKLTPVPVAPVTAKKESLEISICNPRLK